MKGKVNILITGMYQTGVESVTAFVEKLAGRGQEFRKPCINRINEELLASLNSSWDQPDIEKLALGPHVHIATETAHEIEQIFAENEEEDLILADPLFCLTASHWADPAKDTFFIVCVRNPLDTARALSRKYGFSWPRALALWECYYWSLLHFTPVEQCVFIKTDSRGHEFRDTLGFLEEKLSGLLPLREVKEEPENFVFFSDVDTMPQAVAAKSDKLLSFEKEILWEKLQQLSLSMRASSSRPQKKTPGTPSWMKGFAQQLSLLKNPAGLPGILRSFLLLRNSPAFFDRQYYLQKNPDIALSGMDPLLHFLFRGWKERRDPSPHFSVGYYLQHNPDIRRAGCNPLIHYIRLGSKEGRRPSPNQTIEDIFAVRQEEVTPELHVLELLHNEGRHPQSLPAMNQRINFIQAEKKFVRMVSVIIPVYLANEESIRVFQLLLESLISSYPQDQELLKFIFIDDFSPMREMQNCIQKSGLAGRRDIRWLANETNKGFVKTVNRGFGMLSGDSDAVILNSDTEIHGPVFEILQELCLRYVKIASVTPLSNRATINSLCSWPFGEDSVFDLEPRAVAAVVSRLGLASPNEYLPTGHGFCMYMSKAALDDIGFFDEKLFAMGYGEENDWSVRAIKKGWRHLSCTECYVHHHESRSFDNEQKKSCQQKNSAVLSALYPFYNVWVQSYLKRDPLKLHRKLLNIALLEERKKRDGLQTVCFILHDSFSNPFGGVQQYTRQLIEKLDDYTETEVLVIAPTELKGEFYELYFQQAEKKIVIEKIDDGSLLRVLEMLAGRIDFLHLHNTYGLVETLLDWIKRVRNITKIYSIHDYQLFCSNPFLLDGSGRFCLRSASRQCNEECRPLVAKSREFLEHFDVVTVPSENCLQNLTRLLDNDLSRIHVCVLPHFLQFLQYQHVEDADDRKPGKRHIVFLGALYHHKGGELFLDAVPDLLDLGLQPVIWGTVQPELAERYTAIPPVRTFQNYKDLCELKSQYNVELIVMPSVCAETFSYTLYETLFLLETPVVVGLHGHPADIVRQYGVGEVNRDNERQGLLEGVKEVLANREDYVKNIKRFKQEVVVEHQPALYLQFYASLIGLPFNHNQVIAAAGPGEINFHVSARAKEIYSEALGKKTADKPRILMVHALSNDNPPYFYRFENPSAYLSKAGCEVVEIHLDDISDKLVSQTDLIYLSRTPMTEKLQGLLQEAKRQKIVSVLDVDDLLFHSSFIEEFYFLENDKEHKKQYINLLAGIEKTFDAVDCLIGSTPEIAEAAESLGKTSVYFRNRLLHKYKDRMQEMYAHRPSCKKKIVGYFSGSNTHDKDLQKISGILHSVLQSDPESELLVMGFIRDFSLMEQFESRITLLPFGTYEEYLLAMQRCKVVVTPFSAINRFTNAKSNIKFLEAASVGTPVISSPAREMVNSIEHGVTGWLADTGEQWQAAVEQALFEDYAECVGSRANRFIVERYGDDDGCFFKLLQAIRQKI